MSSNSVSSFHLLFSAITLWTFINTQSRVLSRVPGLINLPSVLVKVSECESEMAGIITMWWGGRPGAWCEDSTQSRGSGDRPWPHPSLSRQWPHFREGWCPGSYTICLITIFIFVYSPIWVNNRKYEGFCLSVYFVSIIGLWMLSCGSKNFNGKIL